jgi:hypothetical protein
VRQCAPMFYKPLSFSRSNGFQLLRPGAEF